MKQVAASEVRPDLASETQIAEWISKFACYRQGPTREALLGWLNRFDDDHLAMAHKILDAVTVVSELEIQTGYKDGLSNLPGWSRKPAERKGRWYFVGAGSAGESGPAMLRLFREANGLTHEAWQSYFVTTIEIPALGLTAYDNIVFVDDFAGTGEQIVTYWNTILQELVASEANCYLLLTAITSRALDKIRSETELQLVSSITLPPSANVFSEECTLLSVDEKEALDKYGSLAWADKPRGFGDCGLTLVLSHKTPNNSLPILHANHKKWVGPFPRSLIAA